MTFHAAELIKKVNALQVNVLQISLNRQVVHEGEISRVSCQKGPTNHA